MICYRPHIEHRNRRLDLDCHVVSPGFRDVHCALRPRQIQCQTNGAAATPAVAAERRPADPCRDAPVGNTSTRISTVARCAQSRSMAPRWVQTHGHGNRRRQTSRGGLVGSLARRHADR